MPEIWLRGVQGILKAVADFDFRDRLAKIAAPTLVVHAALDQVMPRERVEALAQGIAGSQLRTHPSSGHALVVEDPAWLAEQYQDFLTKHFLGKRGEKWTQEPSPVGA